jgi:hypothetical protein
MTIDINEIRIYLLAFLAIGIFLFFVFSYMKRILRIKGKKNISHDGKAKKEPSIIKNNTPTPTNESIVNKPTGDIKTVGRASFAPLSLHFRLMPKKEELLIFSEIEKTMILSKFKYTDDQIFIHLITEAHKIIVANLVEPGILTGNQDKPIKGLTVYTEIKLDSDVVLAFDTFMQLLKNIATELNLIIYQSNMKPLTTHSIADIRVSITRNMNESRS